MSDIERLELLMHGVQALRRHVEYLSCPISGASGVRAQFYPHQVQNVQRILSSSRIHHLIADEVGMGKTIQALMIANALRLQMGRIRVRVVVPRAELKNQWIDEIAWRAQSIAELGDEMVGDDWFDVVDDSAMVKPSETLDPKLFDLLILDEPQSLKQDTLRFVASNSNDLSHLLLLTASPNLRDISKFLELLQILEPDRIERARREADGGAQHDDPDWSRGRIGDLSEQALSSVYRCFEERTAESIDGRLVTSKDLEGTSEAYNSFAEYRRIRIIAATRWRYRDVLRSYRADFPDHLPRRLPKRLIVDSTSEERQRMAASLGYLGEFLGQHNEPEHRQIASALLQRTSLGGQSLQNRLSQLRGGDSEHEPRLVQMSDLSRREYADSRLDRLVDWLIQYWQDDPKRKVVIAAEDNATVEELDDELSWRIPEVGHRGARIPLRTVLAKDERPLTDSDDKSLDSQTLRNFANSTLRAFEESEDQLLIAHNVYRQSYNLQAADALIFYSLPWKPEDVDQWIGRVDRLGREYVDPERPNSRPKPVHIVTLHRRGDPTIGVQEVLDEYRVFETAIDPERRLLEEISSEIETRALPVHSQLDRGQLNFEFEEDEEGEQHSTRRNATNETAAPSGTQWTVANAIQLHQRVARREDLGPALTQNRQIGYVTSPSEGALAKWIQLLRSHGWINVIRKKADRRSKTYYTLGQDKSVNVRLDSVQDRNHPFPPFFIARGNIQRPPRTVVETGNDHEGNPRREILQFLSFGSRLHEDLISTFWSAGRRNDPLAIRLYALGKRHYPNGTDLTRGTYLCGVGFIDSGHCYINFDVRALLDDSDEASGTLQESMRSRVVARLEAGVLADCRFVRILRPATLRCMAWRVEGQRMQACSEQAAADLLGANWTKKEQPNTERRSLPESYVNKLPTFCVTQITAATKQSWSSDPNRSDEVITERQEILRIEMYDRIWVLDAAIAEIEAEIQRRRAAPSDANNQAIAANFQPRKSRFEEERSLTIRSYETRIALLERALSHLQNPEESSVQLQCTAVIELENDPVPIPDEDDDGESASKEEFANASPAAQETSPQPTKPR